MQRFTDKTAMQNQINSWKADGLTTAIVPTMGNLHQGHLSLVRTAADHADKVIVSIYINPAQFAAHEDFDTYPRSHDADFSLLEKTGCCDGIYVPDTMYSDSHATMIMPEGAADGFEAEKRPHFFRGVVTIVLKLFNHVPADIAIFGEKDFQQLLVIKQMVADLDVPINIIASPTIRDVDGLALSSRNGYLSAEQRAIAPTLYA
ncbi:MAG: pantoate--beta-alanine ligase, partial [Candidatus Puniceispirillaceae bacterium]